MQKSWPQRQVRASGNASQPDGDRVRGVWEALRDWSCGTGKGSLVCLLAPEWRTPWRGRGHVTQGRADRPAQSKCVSRMLLPWQGKCSVHKLQVAFLGSRKCPLHGRAGAASDPEMCQPKSQRSLPRACRSVVTWNSVTGVSPPPYFEFGFFLLLRTN